MINTCLFIATSVCNVHSQLCFMYEHRFSQDTVACTVSLFTHSNPLTNGFSNLFSHWTQLRVSSRIKMLLRTSCRMQGSSSRRASVRRGAGRRPAAPPQPAGETGWGHAQPGPKSEEQHYGSSEHHQTGQPGITVFTVHHTSVILDL